MGESLGPQNPLTGPVCTATTEYLKWQTIFGEKNERKERTRKWS